MSFDIFLSRFKGGESESFPIAIVERAFGRYAERKSPKWWDLTFPGGGFCDLYMDGGSETKGFTIARPTGNPLFESALFQVLAESAGVIFWPGGGCVVADASVIPDLPHDMVKSLGTPTVVKSGAEIFDCIARSG